MLVYLYNTHLFLNKMLPPPPHRARSYIQTQHRKTGKVGVVRERGRTADDRVIKAELHLPNPARRPATVRPSRLLLMAWASKNWPLLSRPSLRCAGDVKYQVAYNFSICSVLHRLTVPYIAARGHTATYVALHLQACMQNASTYGTVRSVNEA